MNVTNERPPVRVATFQDKTHPQPPKLATPDCCPGSKCADDQPKKTLEERVSGSFKQEVPNFRFDVEKVTVQKLALEEPSIKPLNCCSECRALQSSYTSAPHGNLNNSKEAPLSFSSVNPPVKPPVFVDVHTDIESSKDKSKDNCCLIS